MTVARDPYDRWIAKVDKDGPLPTWAPFLGPCWLWTAATDRDGYGRFGSGGREGRTLYAHRWSHEHHVGPIPEGLVLDHLCRVRHCVNPAHLEPVTIAANNLRGFGFSGTEARQTHCKNGHEFTEGNTYRWGDAPSQRKCRACGAERQAEYRAKRRATRRKTP